MRTKKQICLSIPAACHERMASLARHLGLTNSALVEKLVNEQHAAVLGADGGVQ